jgi:hypothetical protein
MTERERGKMMEEEGTSRVCKQVKTESIKAHIKIRIGPIIKMRLIIIIIIVSPSI